MRRIPLKELGLSGFEINKMVQSGSLSAEEAQSMINADIRVDYANILKMLVRLKDKGKVGYSATEVRMIARLCDLIDAASDHLLLSNKDYDFIKKRLDACETFAVAHKNIVEFLDDFENAEDVKPVKATG